jgi:DNA-binding transcriptional ArsR family regulator
MTVRKSWTDTEERKAVKTFEVPLRVEVFDLLVEEPLTSREIGRRLRQRENLIGYHCRRLVRAGVVEVMDTEQRRGAEAKILRPTPLGLFAREWSS